MSSLKDQFNKAMPIDAIKKAASANGVLLEFIEHRTWEPLDKHSGLYAVVCYDLDRYYDLQIDTDAKMEKILDAKDKRSRNLMSTSYEVVKIPQITMENYFDVHMEITQAIHDMSVVTNAFWEFGLPTPKEISKDTVSTLYELNEKRSLSTLSEEQRQYYANSFKRAVVNAHKALSKYDRGIKREVPTVLFSKHRVTKDYFFKNHISTCNEGINSEFWAFLQNKIKECPDFYYYKERRPYADTIITGDDGRPKHIDFYRISFPKCCESLYYGWMTEYNMRNYRAKVSIDEVINAPEGYFTMTVDRSDMPNVNSLSLTNGVRFAVDTESKVIKFTQEQARKNVLFFKNSDKDMVTAIISRLCSESREYIPCNSTQQRLALEHRPRN